MRPQKPFPSNTVARMTVLLSSTRSINEYRRFQSVYLRAKYGYSASQIAEMVGLKLQTVKNIHAAYLKEGEAALKLSGHKGGGRKHSYLTVEEEKAFIASFEEHAKAGEILEIGKIHVALQQKLGEEIPRSTTYRMLHRHGWRKVAPRPTHPKGRESVREAFKKNFKSLVSFAKKQAVSKRLSLRIMFQDEARFGRINNLRKCWVPLGYRPTVGKQMIREYTYVYAAVSPSDGVSDFLILPTMTTQVMNIFLAEVAKRHKNEFIYMLYDGAPCHKKNTLKVPNNMEIKTLPPYSPQLNPTEAIWDEMREKFFPNLVFDSMEAVEDKLIEATLHFEKHPKMVQSIVGFKWIVSTL